MFEFFSLISSDCSLIFFTFALALAQCERALQSTVMDPGFLLRQRRQLQITVEEEHAIQTDLFVYTRFHSQNIFQVIAKKEVFKHTHAFLA